MSRTISSRIWSSSVCRPTFNDSSKHVVTTVGSGAGASSNKSQKHDWKYLVHSSLEGATIADDVSTRSGVARSESSWTDRRLGDTSRWLGRRLSELRGRRTPPSRRSTVSRSTQPSRSIVRCNASDETGTGSPISSRPVPLTCCWWCLRLTADDDVRRPMRLSTPRRSALRAPRSENLSALPRLNSVTSSASRCDGISPQLDESLLTTTGDVLDEPPPTTGDASDVELSLLSSPRARRCRDDERWWWWWWWWWWLELSASTCTGTVATRSSLSSRCVQRRPPPLGRITHESDNAIRRSQSSLSVAYTTQPP